MLQSEALYLLEIGTTQIKMNWISKGSCTNYFKLKNKKVKLWDLEGSDSLRCPLPPPVRNHNYGLTFSFPSALGSSGTTESADSFVQRQLSNR